MVRLTGPVNPLMLVTLMTFDAHAPMKIVRLDGFVVIAKSGEVGPAAEFRRPRSKSPKVSVRVSPTSKMARAIFRSFGLKGWRFFIFGFFLVLLSSRPSALFTTTAVGAQERRFRLCNGDEFSIYSEVAI